MNKSEDKEVTQKDVERARQILEEEFLENLCKEHDLQTTYDEYSNDFESK